MDAILQVQAAIEQVTASTPNLLQTNSSNLVQVGTQCVAGSSSQRRNVLQLISLDASVMTKNVPRASPSPITWAKGSLHTNALAGAKGNSANLLLDNADNNEVQSAMPRLFPNGTLGGIGVSRRTRLMPNTGAAWAGVVNVVPSPEPTAFHGTAFNFLRNFAE